MFKITENDNKLSLPVSDAVNRLYESMTVTMGNKINTSNIVVFAINLMQTIEKYPELVGSQKKEVVIYVLRKFVIDQLDGEQEQALLFFIDTFLPSVIDSIILIDKKEVAIKIKKGLKTCFTCC